MSTEETGTGVTPEDCELERFERNHYFDGKLLTARDMADEQAYHVDRLATLARYVLGDGVVCGLSVTVEHAAGDEDVTVHVSPGMALDCCGDLVVLEDGATEEFALPATSGDASDQDPELYLYLRYRECFRESVPIPNSGDACEEACEFNRVLEVFDVVAESSPLGDGVDPSTGTMEFPEEDDLAAREQAGALLRDDPELLRLARTYHRDEGDTCPDCEDPHVYLCRLEPDGDGVWGVVADSGTDFVYPNEMLYAAIARHSADFRNPHETSLTVLDAVVSGDESSARVMVEDEATDAEAVTLSSDTDYIRITTPGTPSDDRTVALTTPGIDDLADRVTALETRMTDVEADVADNTTAIGENTSDIADNASDIADNASDIDRLEHYVMDKTLKYKIECFGRLAETFDGTVAGDVADAVVQRVWTGIDDRVFEDPDRFREFVGNDVVQHTFGRAGLNVQAIGNGLVVVLGDHQFTIDFGAYDGTIEEVDVGFEAELTLVELEQLVGNALVNLSESPRAMTYRDAVLALEEALASDETPLDIAIAQDLVCETAEWLEPLEVTGAVSADVSCDPIAAGVDDETTLSGTAVGQGDDVRVYLIGPRGTFLDADGGEGAEEFDVDGEAFEADYASFEEAGTYTFVVVGAGNDGDYASEIGFGEEFPSGLTHDQAVQTVLGEYADGDDVVDTYQLTAEAPSLTVDDFTTNGSVRARNVVVTGTSNREDGTSVFVEVLTQEGDLVASSEAEVRCPTNDWETAVNLSDLDIGQYVLTASDDEVTASRPFTLTSSVIDLGDLVFDSDRDARVNVLEGLGPRRSERLEEEGITMLSHLVTAEPRRVAEIADVPINRAVAWIEEATTTFRQ